MEAALIWLGFGAAAVLTVAVSIRRSAVFLASLVLLSAWIADTVMGLLHVNPTTHQIANLGLDMLFALGFAGAWWLTYYEQPKRRWLLFIAITYAVQVWAHAAQGDAPVSWTYGAVMNGLCALQFAILNLAERPRIGQAIGHAWSSVCHRHGSDRAGNRPRGLIATADALLCKAGGWFLDRPVREKSR